MKPTGIIRRIDDLGRVVIPKEIRRAHRLQEGDPLEIFSTEQGVLFKKYSPIGVLADFAQGYADALSNSTGHIVLISDRDEIIAVAGASKKTYLSRYNGWTINEHLSQMEMKLNNYEPEVELINGVQENVSSYVTAPIYHGADIVGLIVLTNKEAKMSESELKIMEVAATFLSNHLETH